MTLDDIFKSLVWDTIVTAALKSLFAAVPFLSWGPLASICTIVITWVGDQVFNTIDGLIDLRVIAFKKLELAKEYASVTVNLKTLAETKGTDSQEFKDARAAAEKSLSNFIKFNG